MHSEDVAALPPEQRALLDALVSLDNADGA